MPVEVPDQFRKRLHREVGVRVIEIAGRPHDDAVFRRRHALAQPLQFRGRDTGDLACPKGTVVHEGAEGRRDLVQAVRGTGNYPQVAAIPAGTGDAFRIRA